MSKPTVEFVCPDGHPKVIDKAKSNKNWQVQSAICPTCGKRLIVKTSGYE